MPIPWIVKKAAVALAGVALVAACGSVLIIAVLLVAASGTPNASHKTAVLDALTIPAGWQLIHTTVMEPGGKDDRIDTDRSRDDIACGIESSPTVARYYLVGGRPGDVYPAARRLITDARLNIEQETGPRCDLLPDSPACVLLADAGSDHLLVGLWNPGDYSSGIGRVDPSRTLVRLLAE